MLDINFKFISDMEGGQRLTGYVPNPERSQSGVTIATGVDLGQMAYSAVSANSDVAAQVAPYIGLQGQAAVLTLQRLPLLITRQQADYLDAVAIGKVIFSLSDTLRELDPRVQTVVASVAYQYGPDLEKSCPRFWAAVISHDVPSMIAELENFGDQYPTRRSREADYLRGDDGSVGARVLPA